MMSQTIIVFWSLFGILMVYDLVRVIKYGLPATVTYMWWQIGKTHPILGTLFGIFCGHLFTSDSLFIGGGVLALLAAYIVYLTILVGPKQAAKGFVNNFSAMFMTGFVIGFFLWSETIY